MALLNMIKQLQLNAKEFMQIVVDEMINTHGQHIPPPIPPTLQPTPPASPRVQTCDMEEAADILQEWQEEHELYLGKYASVEEQWRNEWEKKPKHTQENCPIDCCIQCAWYRIRPEIQRKRKKRGMSIYITNTT